MRILFVGLNYVPERTGIAPYTTGMAEALAAAGHHVRVITTFPHYPEWRFTDGGSVRVERSTSNGVQLLRLRHRLPFGGSPVSRVVSELSFGVRALFAPWGRPDVVVLVSPAMFASALLAVRVRLRRGRRLLVWVQDLYARGVHETDAGDRFGLTERLVANVEYGLVRRAHRVVAIHDRMGDFIAESAKIDRSRIVVVHNWSHVEPLARVGRARMRERLGWGQHEAIALHTGNMGAKQALGNVVAAARLADRQQLSVRFVLMGDGNARAELERLAKGTTRIDIVDGVPNGQYFDALRAADVLLVNEHASLRTTALPSKLTSYFTSGHPVIAATSAESLTAAELANSGAGLRIDADDPVALLQSVQRIAEDPKLAHRLGECGRKYGQAHLTARAALEAFEKALGSAEGPLMGAEDDVVEPADALESASG